MKPLTYSLTVLIVHGYVPLLLNFWLRPISSKLMRRCDRGLSIGCSLIFVFVMVGKSEFGYSLQPIFVALALSMLFIMAALVGCSGKKIWLCSAGLSVVTALTYQNYATLLDPWIFVFFYLALQLSVSVSCAKKSV
jgi:hypothetical protein